MNKDNNIDDVRIEHINPRTELNDLEKTAILQFEIEREQELSKTQKFRLLNKKRCNDDFELPKKNADDILPAPKKKIDLSKTIKLKISDLRDAIEAESMELPDLKQKKSLYDTVIIKLDDLINKKNALKMVESKKVTSIEETKKHVQKKSILKPRDITKLKDIKLNVNSPEFGKQLYNLNKIALNNLSLVRPKKVRRYSSFVKLDKVDKVHVNKTDFEKYQKELNKFAINKLYYKCAPKESNKYKLYKYSVIACGGVFAVTLFFIFTWFYQGIAINNLSNSLKEEVSIKEVNDGELFNVSIPEEDIPSSPTETPQQKPQPNQESMYWRYLNTPLSSVDFSELLQMNDDTIGWLIVNNTNINYPVVQTTNNNYYLNHAFDKSYNNAGWVYADYRDDFNELSKNTVVYAHGRKDKVMFGSLTNTLNANWYMNPDNQIIQFSTLNYNTMWQVFSVYKVEAESYYITTDFSTEESFASFVNVMKNRSIYDFGVDVSSKDKILTLSTCYNDNGIRLVLQAKLVKIQKR